jgi:hypothetical protein
MKHKALVAHTSALPYGIILCERPIRCAPFLVWQPHQLVIGFILIQSPPWMMPARAQSPPSIIKDFGPFGTWADDCATPSGPINPYADAPHSPAVPPTLLALADEVIE